MAPSATSGTECWAVPSLPNSAKEHCRGCSLSRSSRRRKNSIVSGLWATFADQDVTSRQKRAGSAETISTVSPVITRDVPGTGATHVWNRVVEERLAQLADRLIVPDLTKRLLIQIANE